MTEHQVIQSRTFFITKKITYLETEIQVKIYVFGGNIEKEKSEPTLL